MRVERFAAVALLAVTVSACLWQRRAVAPHAVTGFVPLPPAVWGCGFDSVQRITARHGDRHWEAVVMLRARPDGLRMAALAPSGVTLFVLEQAADGAISVSHRVPLPEGFDARLILRDLQLAGAPAEALQGAVRGPGRLQLSAHSTTLADTDGPLVELSLPEGRGPGRPVRLFDRRHGCTLVVDPMHHAPRAGRPGACEPDP